MVELLINWSLVENFPILAPSCSDLDIDEDADEEYLLQEQFRMKLEEEEMLLFKEEKILEEENRLRLEGEARLMREEEKLLEDEKILENDYKKHSNGRLRLALGQVFIGLLLKRCYGSQYYACPTSKPKIQDRGCGYFMWNDDLRVRLSSFAGPSTSLGFSLRHSTPLSSSRSAPNHGKAVYLNCKFLTEMIKTLEAKIKILEGTLEMERHPKNHTFDSTAILHELYNDMGRFGLH
nr:hypothetical protein [Tanacetum cinerariifolium]